MFCASALGCQPLFHFSVKGRMTTSCGESTARLQPKRLLRDDERLSCTRWRHFTRSMLHVVGMMAELYQPTRHAPPLCDIAAPEDGQYTARRRSESVFTSLCFNGKKVDIRCDFFNSFPWAGRSAAASRHMAYAECIAVLCGLHALPLLLSPHSAHARKLILQD